MDQLSSSTFSIAKNKRGIFRNLLIMEDKGKCKNPIICKISKTNFIQDKSNPDHITRIYNISLKQIIGTMSITRQFLLGHNRWR